MKPIHEAAKDGNNKEIKRLLKLGVSVDCEASDKSTPLHFAVSAKQTETVRFLIDNKASVNATNERGLTPLHFAANLDDTLDACILLEAGANPNAKDVNVRIHFHDYSRKHCFACEFQNDGRWQFVYCQFFIFFQSSVIFQITC